MASGSETAAEFAELKKDVVEILRSCKGHSLDLGRFKEEYKNKFGKKFDQQYKIFKKGWKLKNLMAKLDDVIYLEESKAHKTVVIIRLKEPDSASHDLRNHLTSPDKCEARAGFQQVKLDSPAKSPLPQATEKESKTAVTANVSSLNNAVSNVSGRVFLKAERRLKKKESKEKDYEPTEEKGAALVSSLGSSSRDSPTMFSGASLLGPPPFSPPVLVSSPGSSSRDSPTMFSGASLLGPPPFSPLVSRLEASGILRNRTHCLCLVCSVGFSRTKTKSKSLLNTKKRFKIQGTEDYIVFCDKFGKKYGKKYSQCLIYIFNVFNQSVTKNK